MNLLFRSSFLGRVVLFGSLFSAIPLFAANQLKELRIDWATYNPVSILLKDQG
jgi:sulfonate transport system substrate-binding protein